ncbi:MAG: hypothetical protein LBT36_05955 [Oscillospiraceae bacterium]|jgi:hypothetical protein|nr:hypothetical protein [Oscillospiraceae bacterium]
MQVKTAMVTAPKTTLARKIFPLTLLLLLTLTACAGVNSAEEKMLDVRANLLAAEVITLDVSLRLDYGARVFDYEFRYSGGAEDGTVTITAPASISGITARVSGGGAEIRWNGVALDTGPLVNRISPAAIVPLLFAEWRGGYVDTASLTRGDADTGERQTLVMTSELTRSARQQTYFDAETLLPTGAEISENGRTVIYAVFTDIKLG